MRRGVRIGLGLLVLLGGLIFFLLTVGSLGEPHADITRMDVADVLAGDPPAERFGTRELNVSGWYAELDADCRDIGPAHSEADWLEATCPLRVLMPYQPADMVTQAELEAKGLRLAAPTGASFPARARPEGPNLRLQQLVFVGHFNDPATDACAPEVADHCRNTFVVSDYDGLLR